MTCIEQLPDDPALLKRVLLAEREQFNAKCDHIKQEAAAQRQEVVERIRQEAAAQLDALREKLEAEKQAAIAALLRRYYGPRCERFDPRQLLLFGETLDAMPLDQASIEDEASEEFTTRRVRKLSKHGRRPLPDHLERVKIDHDLTDDEKPCPCCGEERQRIGQEVSEQLEYFPANFKVLQHIRHKYGCAKCDHDGYNPNITVAPKPQQPIDKGLAGPSLLAYVITSKLGDHLPLYRLEKIFSRQQVEIARSTMCAWMAVASELVTPLVELMTERVRRSQVIHTDDTTVPIQSPGEKQCRKGRIWCYLGDADHPYIVYDYTPNRTRAGPAAWLKGYHGYLQADAYGGYDGVYHSQDVTEVACWAHARRKFYDAQDSDAKRARQMLAMVGELYAVERETKEADDGARLTVRQERSVPLLAKIKAWLDAEREIVLPRSPMAAAITYAINQWSALCVYTTRGNLSIDNNASERALKRVAIGRKNWLFAGNDAFAAHHARLWSLLASAERHALDPQRYLTSVLAKLPVTPSDDIAQFLPEVWKADDTAEPIGPTGA